MAFDFLKPVDNDLLEFIDGLSLQALGKKVIFHTEDEFPNLQNGCIAIVGVLENRGLDERKDHVHLNYIRKQFYSLYPGNWDRSIVDLGDIPEGNTPEDTSYAVKSILSQLIAAKVIPIVLGGSQEITYAMYRAYDKLEQMVNLAVIDSKFDFGKEDEAISAKSYLTKIIVEEPNNLFNYSNIGYQTYLNPQEEIDLVEKLFFDAYRLGEVAANPSIAEPVFRDADVVSIDMTAVKSSNSGNFVNFIPNGFDGKEICTLARYAGISDKVTAFGVFNHNNSRQESVLISQVLWYFIEGIHYRSNEYPFGSKENYLRYIVPMEDEEVVFYKSDRTDRWWIEIPFIQGGNNKLKRNTLLPCIYEDYLKACNNELPERWWKAQRKNII